MWEIFLDKDEQKIWMQARDFAKSIEPELIRKMDAEQVKYPREFVKEAANRKLLGIRFDPKYGGRGSTWPAECAAIEEVGTMGCALGCLFSLPSIIGEAIYKFGSEKQKKKFLEPMLKGELTCAEGLTEPRGGSDFFGTTTKAVLDGNEFVLTGQKRFVVGAEGADFFLIYAKTDPNAEPHKSLSVFIVERDRGVKVEYLYDLMGARGGGTGRIVFDEVRVPKENLVGPLNGGGMIFNQMMIPERLTSAAGAVGTGRAAIEVAARYSTKRKAFGRFIRDFQGVSFKVADSVSALDAARSLVYAAGKAADMKLDARKLVSEAKKVATEAAWLAVNNAMQIMGGIGYTKVFPIERLMRDMRLGMIWTGTNEVMNLLIQHEYYKEVSSKELLGRDIEKDAIEADKGESEKVYE